jgi:hypothetical protein
MALVKLYIVGLTFLPINIFTCSFPYPSPSNTFTDLFDHSTLRDEYHHPVY